MRFAPDWFLDSVKSVYEIEVNPVEVCGFFIPKTPSRCVQGRPLTEPVRRTNKLAFIAANTLDLLFGPLNQKWLQRARNSTSAEPMWEPAYRQAPLTNETLEKLRQHPQFK